MKISTTTPLAFAALLAAPVIAEVAVNGPPPNPSTDAFHPHSVRCDHGGDYFWMTYNPKTIRFDIHLLPTAEIAYSWDPKFRTQADLIRCETVDRASDYKLNPATLKEGQAIKCDANQPEVYRYTQGQRRWYPNPDVASSWDANWGAFMIVECSVFPRREDMKKKTLRA